MPDKALPDGWRLLELGQTCRLPERQVRPAEFANYEFYVGLENIEADTGRIIEYKKVSDANLKSSKFPFDDSCILYGKLRPYLNKVAIPQTTGICSTDILPLYPISKIVLKEYLYYFLRTPFFVKVATEKSTGANLPRISPGSLLGITIPLPPIEAQREITDVLAKADKIKQKREQAIELASLIVRSAFLKIFGNPRAGSKGWPTVELGKIFKLSSGRTRPSEMKSSPENEFVFPVFGGNGIIGYSDRYFVERPAIVLGRVGQYCGNVHISAGKSWISDNALYSKEFLREDVNLDFLGTCVSLLDLNKLQKRSGQPLITQAIVHSLEIPLPPESSQRRFGDFVARIRTVSARQRESAARMNELYWSITHKAFKGELGIAKIAPHT